jgi:Tfp pilus assembly protein PilZ
MQERAALILDSETQALGNLSLTMISLGLRPLYATAIDELVLLSREYHGEIGAVLLAGAEIAAQLPAIRKRILEPIGLGAAAVVPVGGPLPSDVVTTLRSEGARFQLPLQHEPHELRYVVTSVLAHNGFTEMRLDARAPCDLAATVELQHGTVEGRLVNFSAGGAFVELERPVPPGEPLRLHFEAGAQRLALGARVVWRSGPETPDGTKAGMGIQFVGHEAGVRPSLERAVTERTERLRL